jgi:hypothetical protein
MAKLDLYRKHAADYVAPKKPALVTIPPAQYLAFEGRGIPGGEGTNEVIGALYAVAFTIKMASKFAGRDYGVSKLEGLWWGKRGKQWSWKFLIRTPDFISEKERREAAEILLGKGKPPEIATVRLEKLEEGPCVQMLHVGPYDKEAPTIAAMEEFAAGKGLAFHGLHHEIYLSDPRRVAPERLRTILRHPVKKDR